MKCAHCDKEALEGIKLCELCLEYAVINAQANFGLDEEAQRLKRLVLTLEGEVRKS